MHYLCLYFSFFPKRLYNIVDGVSFNSQCIFIYVFCWINSILYNSLLLGSVRKYQVEKSNEEKGNAVESESMSFSHLSKMWAPLEVFANFFISNHFVNQLDRISAMTFVSINGLVLLWEWLGIYEIIWCKCKTSLVAYRGRLYVLNEQVPAQNQQYINYVHDPCSVAFADMEQILFLVDRMLGFTKTTCAEVLISFLLLNGECII